MRGSFEFGLLGTGLATVFVCGQIVAIEWPFQTLGTSLLWLGFLALGVVATTIAWRQNTRVG